MLVLSRKKNQSIMVGDSVRITVIDIRGGNVRLGVSAPKSIEVHRQEVFDTIQEVNGRLHEAATEDEHDAGIDSDCDAGNTSQHLATDGLSFYSTEARDAFYSTKVSK